MTNENVALLGILRKADTRMCYECKRFIGGNTCERKSRKRKGAGAGAGGMRHRCESLPALQETETAAPEHTPARGAGGLGMSRHSCTSCSLSWLPQEEVDFNSKAEVDPKELMTRVCHLITRLVAGSVLP